MKKVFISFFIVSFLVQATFTALAQEAIKDTSYWKKASQFGLNLSQGTFSGSWQGGVRWSILDGQFTLQV